MIAELYKYVALLPQLCEGASNQEYAYYIKQMMVSLIVNFKPEPQKNNTTQFNDLLIKLDSQLLGNKSKDTKLLIESENAICFYDADDLDIDIDLLDIQNCLEDNNPITETNEDNLKEITTPFS